MKKITDKDLQFLKAMGESSNGEFLAERKETKTAIQHEDMSDEDRKRNLKMLMQGEFFWDSMSNFRKRRARAVNYYRGDQWLDKVEIHHHGCTKFVTEYEYLAKQGRPPIKQNMIRPSLKNLIGNFRANPSKPIVFARDRNDQMASEMMSVALDACLDMNESKERDARELEEFLVSGACVYRTGFYMSFEKQRAIPQFQSVNINRFFYNTDTEDKLGNDVDFVGEIRDLSIDEVVATYAKSAEEEKRIRTIYKEIDKDYINNVYISGTYGVEHKIRNIDFYYNAEERNKCRVIEIWRKESEWRMYCHDYTDGSLCIRKKTKENIAEIEEENRKRKALQESSGVRIPPITMKDQYAQFWKCYHLTPTGDTIYESETPYAHGSHPYVFSFYPMVDGRAWGMVEDLIDQQKVINRNMILFDFINGASAKGVLLVPEEAIADDFSLEDIADEWTKFNGVIKIKAKAGAQIPKQVQTASVHPGLNEMIQMQLQFMKDIGGVYDASLGKNIGSSTPASLYAQQTQNANLNNLDYVSTFNNFLKKRDLRILQLVQQYFTKPQFIETGGNNNYSETAKRYDPEKVRNIEFDVAIGSSADTPAFRALMENTLLELLKGQFIDVETYLSNSSVPYADKILDAVQKQKAIMEQRQAELQQQQMAMQQMQQQQQQIPMEQQPQEPMPEEQMPMQ